MNLPNTLTLIRIIMIPIFLVVYLVRTPDGAAYFPSQDYIAAAIFIIASATDGIDGYIARKYKLVTNLGKFLDPLADKLLVSAALIALVQLNMAPAWIVWAILAREFAVTGIRAIAAADGVVIAASKLGKWKTVSQILAITLLILKDWPFSYLNIHLGQPLLYIAFALTFISGIDYIWKSKQLFITSK